MVNFSEAILENIAEGLIAVDKEKKIMLANKTAEKIFGVKIEALLGKKISTLPLEDEEGKGVPLQQLPITRAITSKKKISSKSLFIRNGQTRIPVSITTSPIKVNGKVLGGVSIFHDISEEKEIDKAKSEFIYIASHGLMTPLSVAKLYLEGLQKKDYFKNAPNAIKDYFTEIYNSNTRSIALVRNLLSVSRIDQRNVQDNPELVNVSMLMEKIVKEMKPIAEKNQVFLHLEKKGNDIPQIVIDPLRLREVLENLITNAIKYNVPGGHVSVIVSKEGKNLLLQIKDTGIGISTNEKSKVFSKFYRAKEGAKRNSDGTGLGLYVVKSYVEEWGGKISVESKVRKGSVFSVRIPI